MVFVSHNPAAVEQLCDRAILLEHGRVERGTAESAHITAGWWRADPP
jgi:ABC-type polysaccharide/polyol phosphate transport system ATPase subunit